MRIAQVAPRGELPWSGILTVVVNLAAALVRRGHEVEIWQLHEWDPNLYADQISILDDAGVHRLQLPVPRRWWRFGGVAATTESRRAIDVAHLHSVFNPPNAAVAHAMRAPYVLSPHGGYDPVSLCRSRYRKAVYARLIERRMLRRASAVVALTDVERGQVEDFGGRVHAVIPNGVKRRDHDPDGTVFRRDLGVDPAMRLAIYAGRLDVRHKGLDFLIDAVAAAPGWHLALVGGDHRGGADELRRLAIRRGADDRVTFVGVRSGLRLEEALAGADLFALLSRWEGLPMALLEALSLGTPALVSPSVERTVGVARAGAGWVALGADASRVLVSLTELDSGTWGRYRESARRLAEGYEWASVARAYERVYRTAMNRDAPARRAPDRNIQQPE